MFTDWTNTDPHYFYLRGMLMGAVLVTLLFQAVKRLSKKNKGV